MIKIVQQHGDAGKDFLIFTQTFEQRQEALHAFGLQPVALAQL